MRKRKVLFSFFVASSCLLSGCSCTRIQDEPTQIPDNTVSTIPSEEINDTSCYDALMQMMEQDGFTREPKSMRFTRGGIDGKYQVLIDFEERFIQLGDINYTYTDTEYPNREAYDDDEEYKDYIDRSFYLFKYDANDDKFLDMTMGSENPLSVNKERVEEKLREMYEKYAMTPTFLGCTSMDSLPWRKFENLKDIPISQAEGFVLEDTKEEVKNINEPIDIMPQFVEVNSIDEFLEYANSKYMSAFENIAKKTQSLSMKKVGVDLLVIDTEKVNNDIHDEGEISPKNVFEYIQDYFFSKSDYNGNYLVFLRLKDGDMEKIKEAIPDLNTDEVMTLYSVPSKADGNLTIDESITDNYQIIKHINDSLGVDAKSEYELFNENEINTVEWQKLFGLY